MMDGNRTLLITLPFQHQEKFPQFRYLFLLGILLCIYIFNLFVGFHTSGAGGGALFSR